MRKKDLLLAAVLLLLTAIGLLLAFLPQSQGLSQAEKAAVLEISGQKASALRDLTEEALAGRRDKYPEVKKVLAAGEDYAFICCPWGYNGTIDLVVVISSASQTIKGVRILRHQESLEYVRDFASGWFVEPFFGKSSSTHFELTRFGATLPEEVDIITGATITSQAVVNGVNAALEVYSTF